MPSSGSLAFGEDILCIFKVYIAPVQRNISVYTLIWISKWKSPYSALPRDVPRILVWHIYSARLCTLIKLQIHMTPEHIKACSVHLLLFRPQTVLKEGGLVGLGGKAHSDMLICLSLGYIFILVPGDIISLSHFSLHEFTSGHWKALQRCQQHQCLNTSPQELARSLKELTVGSHGNIATRWSHDVIRPFPWDSSGLKRNMLIMFRVGDQCVH